MNTETYISNLKNDDPVIYRIGKYGETSTIWGDWKEGKLYIARSNNKVIIIAIQDEDPEFRPSEYDSTNNTFSGEQHILELYVKPKPPCCRTHWEEENKKYAVGKDGILWNPVGMPFIVCRVCGNKRCPKATDCSLECTNSNEPGQEGSIYG